MENSPLITVGVISYYASPTILETLESIKNQDYKNIELIISDDGSQDGTAEIAEKWLSQNSSFFKDTKLLTVKKNSGTTANCNRLLAAANGEYLMLIAADDIFLENTVSKRVKFAIDNPEAKWIFSKAHTYNEVFAAANLLFEKEKRLYTNKWKQFFKLSAEEQFLQQIKANMLIPGSTMIKIDVLRSLGGYDEKYGIIEDAPMNLKLLSNGIKCYLHDDFVQGYRIGTNNVCANNTRVFNIKHLRISHQIKKDFAWKYYSWNWKAYSVFVLYFSEMIDILNMNKGYNKFCVKIYSNTLSLARKVLSINIRLR